jgi:hypothetical protein
LAEVGEMLEAFHGGEFHVGEVDAFDGEFPVVVVDAFEGFGLHDFAVFFEEFIGDEVGGFLLHFELIEFFLCEMVEPDESWESFGDVDHGIGHFVVFKGVEEDVDFA